MTFAPVEYNIDVTFSFGDIRRAWIDVNNSNFVEVYFKSDGFLRVDGILPNMTDIEKLYRPDGKMVFHSPAEHTFNGGEKYDAELQIFYHDMEGKKAIVSTFFDRERGGRRSSAFIEALEGLDSNKTGKENFFTSGLPLDDMFSDID
jgi:predicted dehydrogenase